MWAVSVGECTAKKSVGQAPLEQRHAVIERACEEKQPISIRHLCELLQVNRAWYYAKQHVLVEPSKRAEEVALRDAIEKIILNFSGYGYRRVTHALQRDGWKVNHKHVLRIMREESLLCQIKRHFVHTTDSHHHFPISPNLISGRTPDAPDIIWVADLTYIRLRSEFVAPFNDPGCLFASMYRMEFVHANRYQFSLGGIGRGSGHTGSESRTHSPFRSRSAICQYCLY